ncbi:MAG TPA: hypothetical protein ENK18_10935 [Deltaproteobacteria bacterium]|nr:hypothetical protein [Deltaproteobacteria bacterium]
MQSVHKLILIVGIVAGCKKAPDPAPIPPPVEVNPVEVTLQVAAVSPPSSYTGRATDVLVMGSGFGQGARVQVGSAAATTVLFRDANELKVTLPALPAGTHDVRVINADGREAVLRSGFVVEESIDLARCGYVVVYFDVDRSDLTSAAQQLLEDLRDCFAATSAPITIEGHADERGTTDYNLALGQRRALAVQQLLLSLGVPMGRLSVTSWGEEQPAKRGYGERVWAENRRVELTLAQ